MTPNRSLLSTVNQPALAQDVVSPNLRPLFLAGFILGLGQGGFFDGIVFHQLLQWHHMFSSIETDRTIAGMELNTLGDGIFHLVDWLLTMVGIFLLWRSGRCVTQAGAGRFFIGSLLVGVGVFNLVEGIIDHQILGIHHLKPGIHQFAFDMAFLASGAAIATIGWLLIKAAQTQANSSSSEH